MYRIFFLLFLLSTSARGQQEGESCIDEYSNTVGVCSPINNCVSAKKAFHESRILPTFCSYNAFGDRIVCCRDGSNILNTANKNPDERPVWGFASNNNDRRRISERKCEEYSRSVVNKVGYIPLIPDPEAFSVSEAKCEYSGLELIVGGVDAKLGEFPHMAAIGYANVNGGYDFACGGSLISPRFVLTAAHCNRLASAVPPEPVIVRLGDQNIDNRVFDGAQPVDLAHQVLDADRAVSAWSNDDYITRLRMHYLKNKNYSVNSLRYYVSEGDGVLRCDWLTQGLFCVKVPIRKMHIHPAYNSPKTYDDIALLELASDVKFKSSIRPACLWTKREFGDYKNAIATGWGVTRAGSTKQSDELQKVSLPILDVRLCNRTLASSIGRNWLYGFIDSQMCAGQLKGGQDTCQGDSGAPLQVVSKDNNCIFHIIGVTSFGKKCALAGTPGIYTRISSYIDWIESIVWPGQ